jgi:hypothetical protein
VRALGGEIGINKEREWVIRVFCDRIVNQVIEPDIRIG